MGGRTCTRPAAPASVPADGRRACGGGNGRDPTTDGGSRGRDASRPQASAARASGGGPVDRLSRPAAAVLRWCARLLPAGRAEWAEAILAEAENVPAGWQRLAWLGGGLRMVSGESMIMRKAGAICAFAVAVGCIASLSWPQSAVNRVTVANRVSLLVTVALLVGLWVAGRRLVGPARAGRAQRLVRAGGY